jgi:hypothetical protein
MNELLIGLLILAAASLLPISAYRSNLRSNASWERMRHQLTPTRYLSMPGPEFYSKQLVDRLSDALNHAADFENDYYHALVHNTYPVVKK